MLNSAMVVLSVGLTMSSGPVAAASPANSGVRVLIAPLHWLASPILALFAAPKPLANSAALSRDQGPHEVILDVGDHGSALYLELSGRCRFSSAAIEYADGARDTLDLHLANRGGGLYLLHEFEGDRSVRQVTLGLEALSQSAYVGARIMR